MTDRPAPGRVVRRPETPDAVAPPMEQTEES